MNQSTLKNPFPSLYGLTILLVEPEPEARAFYSHQLEGLQMKVVQLDNPEVMLSKVQKESPDAVILNPTQNMPKALKFLGNLKQEHPFLPVITMTMTMPDDALDAIMQTGVSMHINRELTRPRDLFLALEQILSMK